MPTGIFNHKPHSEKTKRKISKATLGRKMSKKAKEKMSKSLMGHKVSEETRRKIGLANSISQKGKKLSEETKKRMRESLKRDYASGKRTCYWKGKKQSKELIEKRVKAREGYKHSEETKKKISKLNKGRIKSIEERRKISLANKGKHLSSKTEFKKGHKLTEEHIEKLRKAGRERIFSDEERKRISERQKGEKGYWSGTHLSIEARKHLSKMTKGENGNNWQGGITSENYRIRRSLEIKLWREAVFKRDKYICQKTLIEGRKLQCHHICNFADYPELRTSIENGITLSEKAHKKFHKIYGVKNNTKKQLEEFLNNKKL